MKTWLIEPRDPLIVRDGRPFGATPGARAATLPFPFPSTLIGAICTRAGRNTDGVFDRSKIPELRKIALRGPLLVQLNSQNENEIADWFVPFPADALLLKARTEDEADIKRLTVLDVDPRLTSLPSNLLPVGMPIPDSGKPHPKAPRFWRWDQFKQWLFDPKDQTIKLSDLGIEGLPQQSRTHVKIERRNDDVPLSPGVLSASQTAEEGALFQTRGLEFTHLSKSENLSTAKRFALAIATDAAAITGGFDATGGERRMSAWQVGKCAPGEDLLASDCPPEVLNTIPQENGRVVWHCRLVLLTPAHFNQGSQPDWLINAQQNVNVEIKAMAMNRYQVVSGWDFEKNEPKSARRLAPSGAVFFLNLTGEATAITAWAKDTWMNCISDEETDRRDGFGLAALGNWNGKLEEMRDAQKTT